MKLQKDVKITEFKLLPHGFLNYDILPFMAEECGFAIFKIAQSMKEFLFKRTKFLDSEIPELEESEDDMFDNLLEKLGMSSKSDEH